MEKVTARNPPGWGPLSPAQLLQSVVSIFFPLPSSPFNLVTRFGHWTRVIHWAFVRNMTAINTLRYVLGAIALNIVFGQTTSVSTGSTTTTTTAPGTTISYQVGVLVVKKITGKKNMEKRTRKQINNKQNNKKK